MCLHPPPSKRLPRNNHDAFLRVVEQCLSGLGLLRPGECRAKGGAPRSLVESLTVDLDRIWGDLEGQIGQAVSEGKTAKVDWQAINAAFITFQGDMEDVLSGAVEEAMKAGIQEAGDSLGEEIAFDSVDPAVLSSLQGQAVMLCESTKAKVEGDVKAALQESVRLGENLTQAMERLQSISSLTAYETERIARTELARAANTGRLHGYKGRVKKVRWVIGPAYNGECACGEMAGEYTLDEALGLSMPLHPNCDCYWVPVTSSRLAA